MVNMSHPFCLTLCWESLDSNGRTYHEWWQEEMKNVNLRLLKVYVRMAQGWNGSSVDSFMRWMFEKVKSGGKRKKYFTEKVLECLLNGSFKSFWIWKSIWGRKMETVIIQHLSSVTTGEDGLAWCMKCSSSSVPDNWVTFFAPLYLSVILPIYCYPGWRTSPQKNKEHLTFLQSQKFSHFFKKQLAI